LSPTLSNGIRLIDSPCLPNVRRIDACAIPMLDQMHANGIAVDLPSFKTLEAKLSARLGEIESDAEVLVGSEWKGYLSATGQPYAPFSPTSGDQVAELLFECLGLKAPGKEKWTKKKTRLSTEDEVLSSMLTLHPIVGTIADHREISKLLTTYVLPMPGMVGEDGRLRTVFKPNRARTGRLACGDRRQGKPNLQNIPVRGEWGKEVRNCFVARWPGKRTVLVSMDLSQIEMRLAAWLADDYAMARIFVEGLDIHNRTACALFGLAVERINCLAAKDAAGTLDKAEAAEWKAFKHTYRLPAKTLGFGVLYGVTARGLQMQILAAGGPTLTEDECQRYIDAWFAAYPGIRAWMQLQYQRARRFGMVWTAFGRPRLIPEAMADSEHKRSEGDREAGNHGVQGTAGDVLKVIIGEIAPVVESYQCYRDVVCLPLLQIHDELVFEVSTDIASEFVEWGQTIMRTAVPLIMSNGTRVPVESSGDMAERWGELK
jgi:DNA polymerase-1